MIAVLSMLGLPDPLNHMLCANVPALAGTLTEPELYGAPVTATGVVVVVVVAVVYSKWADPLPPPPQPEMSNTGHNISSVYLCIDVNMV